VLLLTNRDSDNVGDQLIEATVISLVKAAFANLNVRKSDVSITSLEAGVISKAYLRTKDPALLEGARRAISSADVVVFGGAPLFNYAYQNFYLRTITTIQLAQEYGVPVLFSSIGVEPFDAENPKCIALKEALASPVVRQITTRDDYASLQKYTEGTNIPIALVSDPAVFADVVFSGHKGRLAPHPPAPTLTSRARRLARTAVDTVQGRQRANPIRGAKPGPSTKTIGLVVTRPGLFKDNGIRFTAANQQTFWLDTIKLIEDRGYDYKLFTTGHFTDEVFLDAMVRSEGIPVNKAAITVNTPEELVAELRACEGVIAYRLHASIASFAYGIPSIGLSWNFKVPYFYSTVGLGERAIAPEQWIATEAVDALERAMVEGVPKDEAFLVSVYETLFSGLKGIFAPSSQQSAYTYPELRRRMPRYKGTSHTQYRAKVNRKLRRAYESYQKYSLYYLAAEAEKRASRQ